VTHDNSQSPPDADNGSFQKFWSVETAAKPMRNSSFLAALYFRVGGPQIQVLAIISHWLVQDAVCVLRLKIAKNFQFSENHDITKILIFPLGQLGKIREATFAAKGGLEIF
jgi:hypothetical protein